MGSGRDVVASIEGEFRRYKKLGEGVIDQLGYEELVVRGSSESLSIATLVWHVSGNLESRFTDFLTSDGEKPWRERESEFQERDVDRDTLLEKWQKGWDTLMGALAELTDEDLARDVTIRAQSLSVAAALHRSLAHASYHVGQMVYIGKMLKGEEWQYLSIPPGGSATYNLNPTREKSSA